MILRRTSTWRTGQPFPVLRRTNTQRDTFPPLPSSMRYCPPLGEERSALTASSCSAESAEDEEKRRRGDEKKRRRGDEKRRREEEETRRRGE